MATCGHLVKFSQILTPFLGKVKKSCGCQNWEPKVAPSFCWSTQLGGRHGCAGRGRQSAPAARFGRPVAPLLVACWQRFLRPPVAQISGPILAPKSGQTWFPVLNKRWPPRVARVASNSLGRGAILRAGSRFYSFSIAFLWRCDLIGGRLDGLVLVLGPPPGRKNAVYISGAGRFQGPSS